VLGVWGVSVIVLDDLIEELGETLVGVVGSRVGTDTGVLVLDSREDNCLEGHS